MFLRRILVISILVFSLATVAAGQASNNPPIRTELGSPFGRVVVRIQEAGGASITAPAWVRIYSDSSTYNRSTGRLDSYQVTFDTVPLGEYHVEVTAPGYLQTVADVSVMTPDAASYVWVELRPESSPNSASATGANSGPPMMAPKARKELELAGAALRVNDLKKAQEHLDRAKKLAPGQPDVHYLQGLIYFQQQDIAAARKALETAVGIYPQHALAQAALGVALFRLGDFAAAVPVLEKAVELTPQDWQSHRALALSHMQLRAYDKARARVERAIETSGDKAPELRVLLARVLIALSQKEFAVAELQSFLSSHPGLPEAVEAKRLLAALMAAQTPARPTPEVAPYGPKQAVASVDASAAAPRVNAVLPEASNVPGRWAPPEVNDTPPLMLKNASCALREVLTGTGKRAIALVENLERVAATEKVNERDLDNEGNQGPVRTKVFDYSVSIVQTRPGNLAVEEDRKEMSRSAEALGSTQKGLGAMALIFHPYYVQDFDMRCEGLTEVHGQPAWSVYFVQKADKPSRIRTFTFSARSVGVPLKGRAWIAANNYQVLRLETDLVAPIKEVRLEREHLLIEYQPVDFKTRKVRLWLPASAEMYSQNRGRRLLQQRVFSEYMVFAVDVSQKPSEKVIP